MRLVESEGVVTKDGYKIPTPYTHEQLAGMIGTKRVPVTRAFRKLKEMGALGSQDRQIRVLDLEGLKHAAESRSA